MAENPIFLTIFRLIVPALLGAILTMATNISSAQTEQGKQLAVLTGQLGIIAQQNSDSAARLVKVEQTVDDDRRAIGALTGRVLVLESKPK